MDQQQIKQEQKHNQMMTYQQYLACQPVSNVFPVNYSPFVSDDKDVAYYWGANQMIDQSGMNLMSSYCQQAELQLPMGTHLSEIVDFERNGSSPPVRKKRKFSELENSKDISAVKLTRDQLLKISSVDLDDYLGRLNLGRNLTKYEEKEIKRQKRLIKNREYAFEARKKKKEYVSNMENEIEILKQEKQELADRVKGLEDEVHSLRSELERVSQSDSTMNSSDEDYQFIEAQPNMVYNEPLMDTDWSFSGFQNGFFLMAILFSFGIFFNMGIFNSGMENPAQPISPFGPNNIPENTLPETSAWKGPRKLSSTLDLSSEIRLGCDRIINQRLSVEDVISDENQEFNAMLLRETSCPVSELYPKSLCEAWEEICIQ